MSNKTIEQIEAELQEAKRGHETAELTLTFTFDPRDAEDRERFLAIVRNFDARRIGREDKIDEDGIEIGPYDNAW